MFILSFISNWLKFWSVNHTSIHENSESHFFKNIKFLGEISNNWPKDLLGTNVCKTLQFCWKVLLTTLQCINIISVISKKGTFPPFSSENWLSCPCFFNIYGKYSWISDIEYDPSDNSNSSFYVGAVILNLFFLYDCFISFHV